MNRSVAYYVDGGFEQGLGDVFSLVSLAQEVERATGRRGVFISRADEMVWEIIQRAGFQLDSPGPAPAAEGVRESLEKHRPCAIVSYSQDKVLVTLRLLATAPLLCLVTVGEGTDPERRRELAALAGLRINWDLPEQDGGVPEAGLLAGPAYCLLGRGYQDLACRPRRLGPSVCRVLVSMGGSDLRNLTPRVMRALDLIEGPLEVTVLVGPAFENRREIEEAAGASRHPCRLLLGVLDLVPAMASADVAVSTGGLTLFELAAVGTPTLAVSAVDHQRPRLARFAAAGACLDLGWYGEITSEGVSERIGEVIASPELRLRMSEVGRRLVDGQGARRVAGVIARALGSDA